MVWGPWGLQLRVRWEVCAEQAVCLQMKTEALAAQRKGGGITQLRDLPLMPKPFTVYCLELT